MGTVTPLDVEMQGASPLAVKVFIVIRIVHSFRVIRSPGRYKDTDAVNTLRTGLFVRHPRAALNICQVVAVNRI